MIDWPDIENYTNGTRPDAFERLPLAENLPAVFKRKTQSHGRFFLPPSQIYGDVERFKYPPKTLQHEYIPEIFHVGQARVVGWRGLLSNGNLLTDEFSGQEAINKIKAENTAGYFEGFMLNELQEPKRYELIVKKPGEALLVNGDTYFAGSLEPGNYGSFLLRTLPKLLSIRHQLTPHDNLLISTNQAWVAQFIDLLGIQAKLINLPRKATDIQLNNAYLVASTYHEGFLSTATLNELAEVTKHITPGRHKRVWVSRQYRNSLAPQYRPLTNEAELIQIARMHGFEVVEMEKLSVVEQIAIMKGAEVVCGPSGSGLLNSIFCKSGAKIIELESFTYCIRQHGRVYSSCGHEYVEVFGQFDESDERDRVTKKWSVNPTVFRDLLMESI